MSRSGFSDYSPDSQEEQWASIRFRGQVASAVRGKRGQAFLRELIEALDAMPERRLIAHELQLANGEVCAIGSVGLKRGMDMKALDPDNYNQVADAFGVAHQLVREIEWMNDDAYYYATPEQRWQRMREWAVGLLR